MNTAQGLGYVGIFIAAFLACLSALAIQWMKTWIDEWSSRADEIAELLLEIADLAGEYWISVYEAGTVKQTGDEAKIIGRTVLLKGLIQPFLHRLPQADKNLLVTAIGDFLDATTGGDFKDSGRDPEPNRATECHNQAARAVAVIRLAHRQGSRLRTRLGLTAGYYG